MVKTKMGLDKKDLKDFEIEICGENLYGEHSIVYSGLDDHFYVFGVRDTKHNIWLSWDETEMYANLFDFKLVPILNVFDENSKTEYNELKYIILNHMNKSSILSDDSIFVSPKEGMVIRMFDEFNCDMFYNSVFKYVREKHVKTDQHWSKNWKRSLLNYELKKMIK